MSLEEEKFRGREAKSLLENKIHKDAVAALDQYIESKALSVDPNNAQAAQIILITKQIAKSYIRELERMIENGNVAQIRIAQLEPKKTLFNRGH